MPSGIPGILSGLPQLWQNLLENYPHQFSTGKALSSKDKMKECQLCEFYKKNKVED